LPCFAHQINLCVGEIFKESTEFNVSIKNATRVATYFKNGRNKFFIGCLRDIQCEIYNKCISVVVPGETRWNSLHSMCVSLLKTQRALQVCIWLFFIFFFFARKIVGIILFIIIIFFLYYYYYYLVIL
jgi:hypothetical protein